MITRSSRREASRRPPARPSRRERPRRSERRMGRETPTTPSTMPRISPGAGLTASAAGLVQPAVEVARELAGHAGDRLELLPRGGEHRLGRAEVVEERALSRRADARQIVEDRRGHRPVAADPVVRDREAVGLVADALEQLELRRVVVEQDRVRLAREEHLLDPLGERDDDDPAGAEVLQRLDARAELALAAVYHDQVRQRGERRVVLLVVLGDVELALPLPVAAAEDLGHRREVVGHAVFGAADAEAPVIRLLRRAALEDDHRRDGVRAHERRDVEALDAQRDRVEAERVLEAVEGLGPGLPPALGLELLLVELEARVALGEVEDAPLVAALGFAELHGRAAAGLGRLAQGLARDSGLHRELRRDLNPRAVVLRMNASATSRR